MKQDREIRNTTCILMKKYGKILFSYWFICILLYNLFEYLLSMLVEIILPFIYLPMPYSYLLLSHLLSIILYSLLFPIIPLGIMKVTTTVWFGTPPNTSSLIAYYKKGMIIKSILFGFVFRLIPLIVIIPRVFIFAESYRNPVLLNTLHLFLSLCEILVYIVIAPSLIFYQVTPFNSNISIILDSIKYACKHLIRFISFMLSSAWLIAVFFIITYYTLLFLQYSIDINNDLWFSIIVNVLSIFIVPYLVLLFFGFINNTYYNGVIKYEE